MMWVSLMYYTYILVQSVRRYTHKFQSNNSAYYHMYLHMILQILTPLFGWIADAWIGGYTVIPQYVSKYFGIHNSQCGDNNI